MVAHTHTHNLSGRYPIHQNTATVDKKVTPGKTDPFGTGKILVTDCLDKFRAPESDPFLMLHHCRPASLDLTASPILVPPFFPLPCAHL